MDHLTPEVREKQNLADQELSTQFATFRVDRDVMNEPVLWLNSINDVYPVLEKLTQNTNLAFDRLSDITAYDNIDHQDGPKTPGDAPFGHRPPPHHLSAGGTGLLRKPIPRRSTSLPALRHLPTLRQVCYHLQGEDGSGRPGARLSLL